MAENNPATLPMPEPVNEQWAVIQKGFITPAADIISFKDAEGNEYPQVLSVWGDRQTAERRKSRLAGRITKIVGFNGRAQSKSTPILGVMQIAFPAGTGRKPMTDEQKKAAGERLKAARKRVKGK